MLQQLKCTTALKPKVVPLTVLWPMSLGCSWCYIQQLHISKKERNTPGDYHESPLDQVNDNIQ